jgi:hypothetical protein
VLKLLIYLYHLILSSILVGFILFLLFGGVTKFVLLGIWISLFSATYLYLDKLILYLIGAREIIDSDYQTLFQYIKSSSYQNFESYPKVYVYSGFLMKAFVLNSRDEWTIVMDRKLMETLSSEQIKYLINYLVRYKKTNVPWRQTKSMGLNAFFILGIYTLLKKVMFLNVNSYMFKVLSFFLIILFKPIFELVAWTGRSKTTIGAHYSLESIVNINKEMSQPLNFSQYAFSHIQNNISTKEMIIKFIETIPTVESSQVKEVL